MRLLRGLAGLLLWILAGVLGLVSLLLCVTIILLPLGIPLFRLARSMFGSAVRLMLPRAVAHPVKETRRAGRRHTPDPPDVSGRADKARKKTRKAGEKIGKQARKKVRRATGRKRKLFA
jgi:hypothetical protein